MAIAETGTLDVFTLRTPLLSSGRKDRLLSETDDLWLHVKVYASGGENNLHRHPTEDHAFVVLSGQATFYDRDETPTVVGPFHGVMLPKGTFYHFCSSAEEPLVMLRIGTGTHPFSGSRPRLAPDGTVDTGTKDKSASEPIVEIPERFFPA
jgi:mannose-6-phosphate isomerase-like protein (cupin superfamily)